MTSPVTIESLQAQIAELRNQQAAATTAQQAKEAEQQTAQERNWLQSMPIAERPMAERELRVRSRERALQAQEEFLNTAALAITKKEYSAKLFLPESTFDGLDTIAAIVEKGKQVTLNMPPEQLRQIAALNEALGKGQMPDPAAVAAATAANGGAPGSATPPAGMGTAAGGGTAPQAPNALEEITKQHEGKGSADIASWLSEVRQNTPLVDVNAAGPPAPAPAYTPEQSGVVPPTAQPAPAA